MPGKKTRVFLSAQAFDDFCEARRQAQLAALRRRKEEGKKQEGCVRAVHPHIFDDFDFSQVVLLNPEALDVGEDDEL